MEKDRILNGQDTKMELISGKGKENVFKRRNWLVPEKLIPEKEKWIHLFIQPIIPCYKIHQLYKKLFHMSQNIRLELR